MGDKRVDVVIVGGGIAGIAAADLLGNSGLRVLVLDDNPHPGGQYLRGEKHAPRRIWPDRIRQVGIGMIERLSRSGVEIASQAEVIGIEPGCLLVFQEQVGLYTVRCDRILLATGARERFMPFPGWTLPGVLSTGAVQILIKQSAVPPAETILIGGAGLFLNAVADDILRIGGHVPAVLAENPLLRPSPRFDTVVRNLPKFGTGALLLGRMWIAGTRMRRGVRLLDVSRIGDELAVRVGRVAPDGTLVPKTEQMFRAGCLAVGFGFVANTEAARLAGCALRYDAGFGGWVVSVDRHFETSVPGIYAAGEITAIGGAAKSLIEGKLAALGILTAMGKHGAETPQEDMQRLYRTRRRLAAFSRYFNAQYTFSPEYLSRWIAGLPDDVEICRCEGTRLGELRRAVADGFTTPAGLKKATRCGMGICQGSTCLPVLMDVVSVLTEKPLASLPLPSVRTPLRPIPLGILGTKLNETG